MLANTSVTTMAASSSVLVAQFSYSATSSFTGPKCLGFSRHLNRHESGFLLSTATLSYTLQRRTRLCCLITCSASDEPTSAPQFRYLSSFRFCNMFMSCSCTFVAYKGYIVVFTSVLLLNYNLHKKMCFW